MSNEETASTNNMEELMALMKEEDEHNKGVILVVGVV
jgi:hypothetical protein